MESRNNEELVSRIRAGLDPAENMLQLWKQNQGIIRKIASKYQAYEDIEDLTQQGYIGLCNAVEAYRPEEGVPFVNYAAFWIRQSIYRYVQECAATVRIPVNVKNELHQYRRFYSTFERETGRKPSEREICLYMGCTQAKLQQIQKMIHAVHIQSLDSPVPGLEAEEMTIGDTVADDSDLAEEAVERLDEERLRSLLWPMVDELPGNCGAVIRMHYQERATLKEAGERIGVSIEAARQWERKGLRELRRPSRARKLRPYLDEAQESAAYHTGAAALFERTWASSTERAAIRQVLDIERDQDPAAMEDKRPDANKC